MEYLATISPQGITILIETYNIVSIQLLQPINYQGKDEQYYIVLISYTDDHREQTVISHSTWEIWQEYKGKKNENK